MRLFRLLFCLPSMICMMICILLTVGASAQPKGVPPKPSLAPVATVALTKSNVLSLKQAVEKTLQYSPTLKKSQATVDESRYNMYASRSSLLPSVTVTGTASEQKDSVANRTPGSQDFAGSPYNLYDLGVRAEQPLLAYGFFSGARQGRINEEIERSNFEISRRDVTQDVISAYYSTVMNENLVRVYQDQEKSIREILNIARRRMSFGGKRLDYLQCQTKLATLLPKITNAQNSLAASTAKLAQLMGLESAQSLTIAVGLPEIQLKSVLAQLETGDSQIPELTKVRLQREYLTEEKAIVLGKSLPNLKLTGDYKFQNYTKAELFESQSRSWTASLVLTIPLFSGLSIVNERRAVVAQEFQKEAEEKVIRNDLAVTQITSRTTLESAEASLQSANEALKLAHAYLAEARQNYEVGLITFLEFNTAQESDFSAATTLLQTRYDAISAYSSYFASSGLPLSKLVDILSAAEVKR